MPAFTALHAFVAVASALTLTVMALLLRPLWHGRLLLPIAIATVLTLSTFALYRVVGTPAALDQASLDQASLERASLERASIEHAARQPLETLPDAVAQLEAALQRDPDQAEGWRLLGRAYAAGQQPAKAREAYARAASLSPQQPDVLVEAAEARALADPQRRFDPQAVALLDRALQLQPQHQRARWFLGIAQRQAGQHAQAARSWEALLTQVDARTAASLRAQIDAARADAGLAPVETATATDHAITVKVALDPEFAARVRLDGNASVFVIARVPDGPPMPVAVEKRSVRDLPLTITLDDADSPMPTQTLSMLKKVELVARLSASGNASRQEGDIESASVHVLLPATEPVELRIGK